jgi:uncharacterized membrane protein SpoIIM required for sporulation
MIFGVFFGVIPLFLIITNGYFVGFISLKSIQTDGILSLWKLLPHGILELFAVFISLGLGFRLGTYIFFKDKKGFWNLLRNCLKTFVFFVLPLLFLAAIIEGLLIYLLG